jgi:hypothetical protein
VKVSGSGFVDSGRKKSWLYFHNGISKNPQDRNEKKIREKTDEFATFPDSFGLHEGWRFA